MLLHGPPVVAMARERGGLHAIDGKWMDDGWDSQELPFGVAICAEDHPAPCQPPDSQYAMGGRSVTGHTHCWLATMPATVANRPTDGVRPPQTDSD